MLRQIVAKHRDMDTLLEPQTHMEKKPTLGEVRERPQVMAGCSRGWKAHSCGREWKSGLDL